LKFINYDVFKKDTLVAQKSAMH